MSASYIASGMGNLVSGKHLIHTAEEMQKHKSYCNEYKSYCHELQKILRITKHFQNSMIIDAPVKDIENSVEIIEKLAKHCFFGPSGYAPLGSR